MKICLIDDDPDYHQYILDVLHDTDLITRLHSWHSVGAALREIPLHDCFDLYMVDWHFVGESESGYTVIQQILADFPEARVVLCTHIQAACFEPELLEAVSTGRVAMLEKFRNEADLFCRIEQEPDPGRKILVLDDDPDDAELIGEAIQTGSNGRLTAVLAVHPKTARAAIEQHPIDGHVLDFHLGDASETGIGFLKSLPAGQRARPTVLVTGLSRVRFDTHTTRMIASGELFLLLKNKMQPQGLCARLGDPGGTR